jgi:hypothetical protein
MESTLIIASIFFAIAFIYCWRQEQFALYHPLFLLFLWHFLGYILIPWKILIENDYGYWNMVGVPLQTDYYIILTIVLHQLGLTAVIFGYFWRGGAKWANKIKVAPFALQENMGLVVGIPFIILGAYGALTYHGIPGFLERSAYAMGEAGSGKFTNQTAYISHAFYFLSGVTLVWYLLSRRKGGVWSLLSATLIFAFLAFTMLRGWGRSAWVLTLLGLLTLYLIQERRRWPPRIVIAAAVPLFLIFNISGLDRDAWKKMIQGQEQAEEYIQGAEERVSERFMANDISNFVWNVVEISVYDNNIGHEWGCTYFNAWLVAALPRVIFKEKDTYFIRTNFSQAPAAQFSWGSCTGLYIDFYNNFGPFGMLLLCFLFGAAIRCIWQLIVIYHDKEYDHIVIVYAGFMCYYPELLRNGLGSLVSGYFFALSPILLFIYMSRAFSSNQILSVKPRIIK